MKFRLLSLFILLFSLSSCDSDFRQGRCDEGFFEQTDGNGGFLCAPINEEGLEAETEIDSDKSTISTGD